MWFGKWYVSLRWRNGTLTLVSGKQLAPSAGRIRFRRLWSRYKIAKISCKLGGI